MEKQEIFDTVARHLFAQGERAVGDTGACQYRATKDDGRVVRCAVGALLPDAYYAPSMDADTNATDITSICDLAATMGYRLPAYFFAEKGILAALQNAHDLVRNWDDAGKMRHALSDVAAIYSLSAAVLADLHFPGEVVA